MTAKNRAIGASTATPEAGTTTPDTTHLHRYLTAAGQIDGHKLTMDRMGWHSVMTHVTIPGSAIDRLQRVSDGINGILHALAMEDQHTLQLGDYIRHGLTAALRVLAESELGDIADELAGAAQQAKSQRGAA